MPCLLLRSVLIEARILSDEHFDTAIIEDWAAAEKSNIANYLTLVLETNSFEYRYGYVQWIFDVIMSFISFECTDLKLRQVWFRITS